MQSIPHWFETLRSSFGSSSKLLLEHTPQLISALSLLVLGIACAYFLQFLVRKIISSLDSLFSRTLGSTGAKQVKTQQSYAYILGKATFWCTLFFFLDAAASVLGWKVFEDWMDKLVGYIPTLISTLLILLTGYLLSSFTRSLINRSSLSTGNADALLVATMAQWLVMFLMTLVAVQQLGIDISILTNLSLVVIGGVIGGAMLSLSLGSKKLTANVIGAQYARSACKVGEQIRVGDVVGQLIEITQSSLVVQTEQGVAIVPGSIFHEHGCLIIEEHN